MDSPRDLLEKSLGLRGVGRCGRRTLYVPIINPLALTIYTRLFAFQALHLGAWGRGETVAVANL